MALAIQHRSRGACGNCRRRKRKCNEARPSCGGCVKRNISCDGYDRPLQWNIGVASRGHLTGATAPVPESVPRRQKGRQRDLRNARQPEHGTQSSVSTPSRVESTASRSAVDQARFNKFLASDHFELLSTRIDDSPLTELVPKLVEHSNALYEICVTMQILIAEFESEEFHSRYDMALLAFRQELEQCQGRLNVGTLAAGLLLCSINIVQGLPWTAHIRSLHELLWSSKTEFLQQILSKPSNHFVEVMGVMDIPTFVIGRKQPSLGIWKHYRQGQATLESGRQDGIEPTSGLPRSLLDLFADIETPGIEEQFWLWPGELGDILQQPLWEAFRFAGILACQRLRRKRGHEFSGLPQTSSVKLPEHELLCTRLMSCLYSVHLGLQSSLRRDLLIFNALPYPTMIFGFESTYTYNDESVVRKFQEMVQCYLKEVPNRNSIAMLKLLQQREECGRRDFDEDQAAHRINQEIAIF